MDKSTYRWVIYFLIATVAVLLVLLLRDCEGKASFPAQDAGVPVCDMPPLEPRMVFVCETDEQCGDKPYRQCVLAPYVQGAWYFEAEKGHVMGLTADDCIGLAQSALGVSGARCEYLSGADL